VSALEERLSKADEWGDLTTQRDHALATLTADKKRLEDLVADLKGEVYALRKEAGQASQSGEEASIRLQGAEKELATLRDALERSTQEAMQAKTELSAVTIRFEDTKLAVVTAEMRAQTLQKVIDEQQDEISKKAAALVDASRSLAMMRSASMAQGAAASPAMEQLKADMMSLRKKISDYEEEKRA
jgi:chromosome segregation ATPase